MNNGHLNLVIGGYGIDTNICGVNEFYTGGVFIKWVFAAFITTVMLFCTAAFVAKFASVGIYTNDAHWGLVEKSKRHKALTLFRRATSDGVGITTPVFLKWAYCC